MKTLNVIRRQEDFDRLHRKGKSAGSKHVVFVYIKNDLPYNRTAFLASKKVGNSVQRHRAVRLMREAFRLLSKEYDMPEGNDLLLIARNTILDSKCADVKRSVEAALKRAGYLK